MFDVNEMTKAEEYNLLRALGRSDRKAFVVLYNLYAGKCLSFVESLVKDHDAAKDITHDVFLKVWLKRDLVSKVDNFSKYLYRVAKNAVLDKFESDTIKLRYIARQRLAQEEFRACVDEKVGADELQMLIYNAVNQLPNQRKKIFVLSRYKGLSNSEIAQICGLSIRTVENHITNALADIRLVLAENSI